MARRSRGGRFDHGHVTQADQRHVQGARNGSGGKGQSVDILAHFLEALFVSDPETLFFVDNEQTEILKLNIFGEQAVGADDYIDFPGLQVGQDDSLLRGAAEAAEHLDARGESRETFFEGFEMLESKNRGGSENGDLLVFTDGLEGGAHSHFGFAVAHIATDEAVHRR